MKKLNNKGFILAETLIVCLFLMVIFTMIYTNFFPIIGSYEARENYDDVDGKYTAYWIKRFIESDAYSINSTMVQNLNQKGYMRFECKNVKPEGNQQALCQDLVNSLNISNCDDYGNNCDIFITRYSLGNINSGGYENIYFKKTVKDSTASRYNEFNSAAAKKTYFNNCCFNSSGGKIAKNTNCKNYVINYFDESTGDQQAIKNNKVIDYCYDLTNKKVFDSGFKDYILSLPDYSIPHNTTGAHYRVIVVTHVDQDGNNYYSYSTMEVSKEATSTAAAEVTSAPVYCSANQYKSGTNCIQCPSGYISPPGSTGIGSCKKTITVKYYRNGGVFNVAPKTENPRTITCTITATANPMPASATCSVAVPKMDTRSGYTFKGWGVLPTSTTTVISSSATSTNVNSDRDYYAVWSSGSASPSPSPSTTPMASQGFCKIQSGRFEMAIPTITCTGGGYGISLDSVQLNSLNQFTPPYPEYEEMHVYCVQRPCSTDDIEEYYIKFVSNVASPVPPDTDPAPSDFTHVCSSLSIASNKTCSQGFAAIGGHLYYYSHVYKKP